MKFYNYKFTTYYNFINIQLLLSIDNIDISGWLCSYWYLIFIAYPYYRYEYTNSISIRGKKKQALTYRVQENRVGGNGSLYQ